MRELSGGWSTDNELAALNAEICFSLYRATLAAGGVKSGRLPQPLHIPRPEPATVPDDAPEQLRPATHRAPRHRHATTPEEIVAVLAHGFGRR